MTESYFIRGHKALESDRALSAFRLFLLGATNGDPSCQQVLGYLYEEGIGVKANLANAIYWYDQACIQGESSAAAYNLALLYRRTGQERLAVKYLRRAAKLGDEDAQQEMAKRK